MNEKKSNIENKILEKVLQLWKQELGNKIKLIEPDSSKMFGKNKDNINGNKFDLDFDVSAISSRLADGTRLISQSNDWKLCNVVGQFYQHFRLVKSTIKQEP